MMALIPIAYFVGAAVAYAAVRKLAVPSPQHELTPTHPKQPKHEAEIIELDVAKKQKAA